MDEVSPDERLELHETPMDGGDFLLLLSLFLNLSVEGL
jgi:hypothetical protein